MGKFNGKDATVWMRSIRPHTYEGHPKDVGDVFLAHEEMVETIINLKMAVLDTPPPKAIRAKPVSTPKPEKRFVPTTPESGTSEKPNP